MPRTYVHFFFFNNKLTNQERKPKGIQNDNRGKRNYMRQKQTKILSTKDKEKVSTSEAL